LKVSFLYNIFFLNQIYPKRNLEKNLERERERGMCVEKDLADATIDFII
jgi:hypothetical protein